jgi:hypothetical protein
VSTKQTVDVTVDALWAARSPDPGRPWLAPFVPSDVRRRIVRQVALRHLGIDPGPTRPLERYDPATDGASLRRWFGDGAGWALVEELCTLAASLKRELSAADPGSPQWRRGIGLWALGQVGSHYHRRGEVPTADDLARFAVDRRHRWGRGALPRQLSLQEFVAAADPTWHAEWPVAWPEPGYAPAALGLGRDERPPLVSPRGNWKHGTDRDLYHRYGLYFDPRARSRAFDTGYLDPQRHITQRYRDAAPERVALEVVRRACRPLGLSCPGHAPAVAAAAHGLRREPGPPKSGPDLVEWTAEAEGLPTVPDADLSIAVRTYAAFWIENSKLAGQLDVDDDRFPTGVVRRLWHRLHGREIEWETAHRRSELASQVRWCFAQHLRDLWDPPSAIERAVPEEGAAPDPVDRENATTALINDHSDGYALVRAAMRDTDGWAQEYARIVPATPRYLTVAEFRAYIEGFGYIPPDEEG